MVQFEGFPKKPKKNIHFPKHIIKNTQKYMKSFDHNTRGALEIIDHAGFGDPCEPHWWHAITNLLQYDENKGDIWGERRYPCGVNLPGSYFDREEMMKEVTFIAIAVAEPKERGDTNEPELEQLEDYIKTRAAIHTHNQKRRDDLMQAYPELFDDKKSMTEKSFLKKVADVREKSALGKVGKKDKYDLTGFLVVKDISYKPMKQWDAEIGDVYTPMEKSEPFLYVEGLCSNVRGGGALLLDLANIMGYEMGYMGTKLSALTMVISYYFAKFNFRHYTGTFTASRGSRDYMPIPIAVDSKLGADWEQYLIQFMTRGSAVQERWKTLSKQDVDIEHFHRDNSQGIWRDIIGDTRDSGKYPHLNAGAPWSYRSPRTQSIDENMGDMGYYMYFVYNSPYEPLTNPQRFTPTTQFIMGMPQPVAAMAQEDPDCMEKCLKKEEKRVKKYVDFLENIKRKEEEQKKKKRTRKRRKYKKKRTRKRRRKNKRSRKIN